MSNFKDMPLDTTLQKGDVVTISGPGEHDVLVREVTSISAEPLSLMHFTAAVVESVLGHKGRILTRVQRPVPALPTVEGDYIITTKSGARLIRSLVDGEWRFGTGTADDRSSVQARLDGGATLARVIPADEVKRPEVDVAAAVAAFVFVSGESLCADDFASTLRRVLEGEFDL